MTSFQELSFEALEYALPGRVSTAGDLRYGEAVAIWNGAIARKPAVVAHCQDAEDVRRVLGFAREHGVEVSVRGGGHNVAGHALTHGGVVIDLSLQRKIQIDPERRRVRCGGGTRWSELDAACQQHGLAVTGSMISHAGVAGVTLGGGLGWLHSKLGLSSDNLVSVEIVTAEGRVLRASEREHAELFWAVRGGGGNFGVVTDLEFKLAQVGPVVQLGAFFYEAERGGAALRFANQLTAELAEDTSILLCGLSAPAAPFVTRAYHGRTVFGIIIVGFGTAESHARIVDKVRSAVPPLFEQIAPIAYTALQTMFDASAPWGVHAYEKGLYLESLSDAAIAVIARHLPRKGSPLSWMPIQVLGGRYASIAEEATAFGGKRSTRFALSICALTQDPSLLEAEVAWVRAFWSELAPLADNEGGYVSSIAEPDLARVRASYGEAKYARLAAIKAKYDPRNMFHLNANIVAARE
jgi:FAD/FMN-containing dehydrogenase